ncbi:TonB-dependent receptor domain-containing protein [Epibacterium sp. Ofav1-8]|uniref:TonB-dependent receptor domain-containing protein n=1 Tax=Epibacterium sp. Ofav1-8 TaxID=2917735 RepID=UPI001EF61240|nr:TonB-dependent receptor [Epibacterium sp. Ofav1-8]MCG7624613.1 TonB-dependent receptor [Epibacterium sp. Ofav1-8]
MLRSLTSQRGHLLGGTALALLVALPVAAQETFSDNVISLDPIEVRYKDPVGAAADRATAAYVADAEVERARMGDLKDLFAGIASVSVGGAIPVAQKIFVNGVDMLNLTIALDGALQNNRAFHHVSANAFDPGVLKSVRVDPGIAAADTGPNAVAGAVIMETVDAEDILRDGQNFGGTARLSFGDNGQTFGRSLTLAGRSDGGFEFLAYAKSATGDDYEDGSGATVSGTGAELQSRLLKLAYESREGHRVELSGQQIKDDGARPYRANIGAVVGGRPVPETRIYDTTRTSYSLRYENTNDLGMWDPEVVVGYSESDIRVPSPYQSVGISSTLSAKVQNTFHLSDSNTVTAGIDYYKKESEYSDPTDGRFDEAADNLGVFAQARLTPADRWTVSAGLRYDWQDFTGIGGYETSANGASGNAAVTFEVSESFSVRAGYSNVFGGIQLEDNYEFWRQWDYSGLRSARAQNMNLGFDWHRDALRVGGEIFLTEIDDARGGGDTFDFQSRGYNLGATYDWGDGFVRMTYSNSEIEVNGASSGSYEALDYGAPLGQVIALEVQHELVAYDLLIGGSLDMALDYDDTQSTSDQGLEGYQVVNVFAEYTPPQLPALILRASINNLFDESYADRSTYGADYSSIVPLNEPGRTFVFEAIARF